MMSIEQQIHATRAEQRKQRLIEAERELAAEEAEALHMTEEQRRILMQSFATVKAEFADLDGLRWTQAALRKLEPPQRRTTTHVPATSHPNTFVVLTNADLANFSSEDTIRVSSSSTQSRPSLPSPLSVTKQPLPPSDPALRHRDGSRSRSPVKGLFPSRPESVAENPSTNFSEGLTPIKAPSSLRFSVPPISDALQAPAPAPAPAPSLNVNMSGSTAFSRHDHHPSPSRIQAPAPPPGLTPGPPSYASPPTSRSDPSINVSAMCHFPEPPNQDPNLTSHFTRRVNGIKRQKTTDSLVSHFHQSAPASASVSPPPITLVPTLSLLSSPSVPSYGSNRVSNTTVMAPLQQQSGNPHKSARARLHSLLHDDNRVSSPSMASTTTTTTAPTSMTQQSHPPLHPITVNCNNTIVPSPPLHLLDTLPSSLRLPSISIDTSPDYLSDSDDDDETPTPSPVADYDERPSASTASSESDFAPWIRP